MKKEKKRTLSTCRGLYQLAFLARTKSVRLNRSFRTPRRGTHMIRERKEKRAREKESVRGRGVQSEQGEEIVTVTRGI